MRHLLQDRIDVFGPDKRLGIFVVQPNILLDGGHQVRHAAEDASTDTLACDLSKPSLRQVQPRRTCRRKVKMEAGMLFQPSFDLGMFVRSVVVENHMDSQPLGVSRSICRRKCRNSTFRCLGKQVPMTLPSSTFNAANRQVVPLRL